MEKRAIDVAKALVRLSEVTIFELRGEWRRLHRMPPPMRLSRDLLIRGIIYQLQERAYGGLSKAAARKLEQAAAGPPSRGAAKPTPSVSLRPGTRLVRRIMRRPRRTALAVSSLKRFQCAVPARRIYAFRPANAALRSQSDNAVLSSCASRDGAIGRHL
jgi:hypothetical protein